MSKLLIIFYISLNKLTPLSAFDEFIPPILTLPCFCLGISVSKSEVNIIIISKPINMRSLSLIFWSAQPLLTLSETSSKFGFDPTSASYWIGTLKSRFNLSISFFLLYVDTIPDYSHRRRTRGSSNTCLFRYLGRATLSPESYKIRYWLPIYCGVCGAIDVGNLEEACREIVVGDIF